MNDRIDAKKEPIVRMGIRVGTCRLYFSDQDVVCPLCRELVSAGTHHACVVNEQEDRQCRTR